MIKKKITKKKYLSLILIMFSLISFTSPVLAHAGDDDLDHHGMMGGFYGGMTGGFGYFGWIFMILVIVVLVLLIIWLIKQIQKPQGRGRKK